jgi:hypothetical protein
MCPFAHFVSTMIEWGCVLPPTSSALLDDSETPYFLWWTKLTIADFRRELRSSDREIADYYLAALLREANTRDVWLFVTPGQIRERWSGIARRLGKARAMWAFLLDIDDPQPEEELVRFRDDLRDRMKRLAVP